MKIALLISGQPRRYREGYQELKKWFLDKYDIDVYLHAWKDTEFKKYDFFNEGEVQKTYEVGDDLYQNLLDWYQPKDYLFEPSIQFDGANIKGPNNQRLNSQMGMWLSTYRSWQLCEESGIEYDLVFKTRYDLLFTHNVANNCDLITDITKLNTERISFWEYAPHWNMNWQINDQLAIGPPHLMKEYCSVFPEMLYNIFHNPEYRDNNNDIFINETLLLDEPHNGESYLDNLDKKLLIEQTLNTGEGTRDEFPIYTNYKNEFEQDIDLVLMETDHYYFYDSYDKPKIAYNVWESTLQPPHFFQKLLEFDQIWVPSKWQADCTIQQGAHFSTVKVVPEGVDVDTFYPEDPQTTLDYVDGRFKFTLFGRWDYRKSTKEIIETFLKEFNPSEPVDLIISVDNPYSGDSHGTTEKRLEHYGLIDERIKIKHFPSRKDYITYLKNGHVFLSCARSEGWNLPLIEAMSCGTPSIYSACSGQMEFAEGKGLPVKILGEKPVMDADYNHFNSSVGNYYEPDFQDLARVMRDAFENYTDHKKRALEEAKLIHRDFNWDTESILPQVNVP
jgi:glycosyltransferase involved in cell wall biosynthesis